MRSVQDHVTKTAESFDVLSVLNLVASCSDKAVPLILDTYICLISLIHYSEFI